MTIHWSLLVPAVVLLLFPADRLLSAQVELRSFGSFQSLENSPRFRPWWWVPALWLDPGRAFLGAFLLRRALALHATRWELVARAEYAVLVVLLAVAVVTQMLTRRGDRDVLLAPLGFVAGIVAGITPWPVAAISLVTALLGLFALRQFYAYFAFGLPAVVLLGFALKAPPMWIVPAAAVFALPLVAGLVSGSALELPVRNSSGQPPRPPSST